MELTDTQKHKLRQVIELVVDAQTGDHDPKYLSVYLAVAADYCREIAEQVRKEVKQ